MELVKAEELAETMDKADKEEKQDSQDKLILEVELEDLAHVLVSQITQHLVVRVDLA